MAGGKSQKKSKTEDKAVTLFREYLRIKTVHPKPDYVNKQKDNTKSQFTL